METRNCSDDFVFDSISLLLLLLQRLGDLSGAIQDYGKCLSIAASVTETTRPTPVTLATVYGNRGVYIRVRASGRLQWKTFRRL